MNLLQKLVPSRFYKKRHDYNPWKLIKGRLIYDNPWITLFHDDVITPGGKDGLYGYLHFKNHAIGIVPVDTDGNTWLVGQYRYALKRWSWEIPEGGCPVGTDPLETAKRELKEEAGITAAKWTHLSTFDLSNCVSDESGIIYLAQDLEIGDAEPDESEELELVKLPLAEAIDMCDKGEIRDAISLIGLRQAHAVLDF